MDREFALVGPRDLLIRRSAVKRVLVAVILLASVAHVVRHLSFCASFLNDTMMILKHSLLNLERHVGDMIVSLRKGFGTAPV